MHHEEFNSEIEKFLEVAKRSIKRGEIPDMEALEQGMREAALRDGSRALSKLLSEIPDYNGSDIQCLKCNKPMSNLGRREKGIKSLLEMELFRECIMNALKLIARSIVFRKMNYLI